jgi:hypothetical protein
LVEEMSVLAPSRKVLAKRRDAGGERTPSVLEGLKECFVRCVLKSAYASLLVTGKCKDVGCGGDVVIGVLEIVDRLLRVADLPYEGSRDEQQRHYGK